MDPLTEVKTDGDEPAVLNTPHGRKILFLIRKVLMFYLLDEASSNTTEPTIPNETNDQDNPPLDCMLGFFLKQFELFF